MLPVEPVLLNRLSIRDDAIPFARTRGGPMVRQFPGFRRYFPVFG
jgi:hypothetical protein